MKLAPKPSGGGLAHGVAAKEPGRQPAWIIYALITFLLCPLPAKAFTAIVAFGDSYTDTGNAPSSPPDYWNGRFSNGPLWIEDLSQMLGFAYNAGNNYAVSGTESDELGVAIDNFPGTTDSANVLFAIWTGNNDIANHLDLGTDDAAWDDRINGIVSSCMTASDLLYNKGARNLVLFNVMDLTRCPDILNSYPDSFRSYILGKIQLFNSRLAAAVPDLLSSHPGLQVYEFDTYSDFNYLLDNYVSLGFYQATIGALNDPTLTDKSFNGPGANYVFWDDQHPTAMTHSFIAQWVASVLPGAPPPPPTVSITAPANGAQFTAPASLSVDATVVANGWSITQVNFYENGALFGQATSSPYSAPFATDTSGTYTLTAQIIYGSGQALTSSPIGINVAPPSGSAPVLNLTPSTPGAVQLTITGSAGDTYVCEASPDLVNWLPVSTNFNSSGTLRLQLPQSGAQNFYRAHILH